MKQPNRKAYFWLMFWSKFLLVVGPSFLMLLLIERMYR